MILKQHLFDPAGKAVVLTTFAFLELLGEDEQARRIIGHGAARECCVALLRLPLEKQDLEVREAVGGFMRLHEQGGVRIGID